jgi:signal peptidase II
LGYVVDFVDVFVAGHHWPAFNVADSALSIGMVFMALSILRQKR